MYFYETTGIRCLFMPIDRSTGDVYWQWLDVLEGTNYFDTKRRIRIYDIDCFVKLNIPGGGLYA